MILKELIKKINFPKSNFVVFFFLTVIIFLFYGRLLSSYFEADEWVWFTHFFPLTKENNGFLNAVFDFSSSKEALSEWQHVSPISDGIFYLNSLIFGLNFKFYILISLFIHSLNSFLVYLFSKELITKKNNILPLTAGLFFAFTATSIHAFTWAAFYGLNVLSVTFFILSIFFLVASVRRRKNKYILLSSLFLGLALFTKETTASLIFILGVIVFLNKKSLNLRKTFLSFLTPLVFYIPYRFIIPIALNWNSASGPQIISEKADIFLIIFRLFTFPLNMLSEVFLPRATIQNILNIITPVIYPQFAEGEEVRSINRLHFLYGPGLDLLIYIAAILIVIWIIKSIISNENKDIRQSFVIATSIIVFSALPLVLNVLNLRWWGIDLFDSRHYYMSSVGAGIIFVLFLTSLSNKIKKLIKLNLFIIYITFFILWFLNNYSVVNTLLNTNLQLAYPRKYIVEKIQKEIPIPPGKLIIYTETDPASARAGKAQNVLPFATSFAQILTVAYFNENPYPKKFYEEPLFESKGEGYQELDERGFGYFRSRSKLTDELRKKTFSINDIYGFYYNENDKTLTNITNKLRKDLKDNLEESKDYSRWIRYSLTDKVIFYGPPGLRIISNELDNVSVNGENLEINLKIKSDLSSYAMGQIKDLYFPANNLNFEVMNLSFDRYYSNEVIRYAEELKVYYLFRIGTSLVNIEVISGSDPIVLEGILGSIHVIE